MTRIVTQTPALTHFQKKFFVCRDLIPQCLYTSMVTTILHRTIAPLIWHITCPVQLFKYKATSLFVQKIFELLPPGGQCIQHLNTHFTAFRTHLRLKQYITFTGFRQWSCQKGPIYLKNITKVAPPADTSKKWKKTPRYALRNHHSYVTVYHMTWYILPYSHIVGDSESTESHIWLYKDRIPAGNLS